RRHAAAGHEQGGRVGLLEGDRERRRRGADAVAAPHAARDPGDLHLVRRSLSRRAASLWRAAPPPAGDRPRGRRARPRRPPPRGALAAMDNPRWIVIGTSFSESSHLALAYAIQVASETGKRVALVHVYADARDPSIDVAPWLYARLDDEIARLGAARSGV